MNSARLPQPVRWIVGVDGSTDSEHALRWSIAHAGNHAASIRMVRAWQPIETAFSVVQSPDSAQVELDQLAATFAGSSPPIEWSVEVGDPSDALLTSAKDADLLLLGTRGLGGLKRRLLGSVSHTCVSRARSPVAIIPPAAPLDGQLRGIVVGLDGSHNAKAALRWALGFATPETTVLVIGTGTRPRSSTKASSGSVDHRTDRPPEWFIHAIEEVLANSQRDDIALTTEFRHGKPASALVEAGADSSLLVVGARGHGSMASTVLGSVTNRVLRESPTPVVVVPDRRHHKE